MKVPQMTTIKRVYIEITNRCNLRCDFCSFHHRDAKEMSLHEFETIIKQVKKYTSFIYLHVQGEPLLHTQFEKILTLCDAYSMNVQLVTNGTFLNKYPKLYTHKSLRKISFSLHSLDYQTIDVDQYMKTILDFISSLNDEDAPYCELRFWTSDNLSDKAKKALSFITSIYTLSPTKKNGSYMLNKKLYLHFENEFKWPSIQDTTNSYSGHCRGAKDMIAILSNGIVVPCCLDADAKIMLGNCFETPLDLIITGQRMQNMIKGFNQNKLIETLCQKCQYRNRFD